MVVDVEWRPAGIGEVPARSRLFFRDDAFRQFGPPDALLFARHLNPSLISERLRETVSMKRDGPIAIVIVYHKAE